VFGAIFKAGDPLNVLNLKNKKIPKIYQFSHMLHLEGK